MTTCLGKSCSFCLPRVPFVNCCQFMYLVIYLLVLRAGCGICLYRFLITAYLFTFQICMNVYIICLFDIWDALWFKLCTLMPLGLKRHPLLSVLSENFVSRTALIRYIDCKAVLQCFIYTVSRVYTNFKSKKLCTSSHLNLGIKLSKLEDGIIK